MAHLKLATHYFGDDDQPGLTVPVTEVVMQQMTPSLIDGIDRPMGKRKLRVRVDGVSPADLQRMQGTVWAYGTITDAAGVTHGGNLSALESRSDDSLEFILSTET